MSTSLDRPSGRALDELRAITFERNFTCHAEGSVLVSFGQTRVLCTASLTPGVPGFLRGKGQGWLTAEYGMLPRSTGSRMNREASRGKQSGRTVEIQRLIGRSLRAAIDLKALGENTLTLDCDVIQADGGTRTASISGACVAVVDALNTLQRKQSLQSDPLKFLIGAAQLQVRFQSHTVVALHQRVQKLMDANALTPMESLVEIVALHHAGHRVLGRQFDHAACTQWLAPLTVVAYLGLCRIQHHRCLLVISLRVDLNLFLRERGSRTVPP